MNSGATGFPASDLISKPPHPTPSHVFTPFSPLPDLESILDRPSHRPATLITDHATRRPVFIAIDPSFLLYFLLILPAPAPDTFSPHSASSIVSRYNPSPSSSPFKFILLPSNLSRRRDLTYAFNLHERASPDISPFHLEILVCSNTRATKIFAFLVVVKIIPSLHPPFPNAWRAVRSWQGIWGYGSCNDNYNNLETRRDGEANRKTASRSRIRPRFHWTVITARFASN